MVKIIMFVLLIIGLVFSFVRANNFGPEDLMGNNTRRVIDGVLIDIKSVPYYVYVSINKDERVYVCGGSIISANWIVTAAHCLFSNTGPASPKDLMLYAGTSNSEVFSKTVQKRNVAVIKIHKEWLNLSKKSIVEHDIALLKTSTPFEFNNEAHPIALVSSNREFPDGTEALACGFGHNKFEFPASKSENLYAIRLRKQKCRSSIKTVFCFEGIDSPTSGICHGDSGGPLVYFEKDFPILIGVTSGTTCKTPNNIGVFTKLSLYRDWIRSITGL